MPLVNSLNEVHIDLTGFAETRIGIGAHCRKSATILNFVLSWLTEFAASTHRARATSRTRPGFAHFIEIVHRFLSTESRGFRAQFGAPTAMGKQGVGKGGVDVVLYEHGGHFQGCTLPPVIDACRLLCMYGTVNKGDR